MPVHVCAILIKPTVETHDFLYTLVALIIAGVGWIRPPIAFAKKKTSPSWRNVQFLLAQDLRAWRTKSLNLYTLLYCTCTVYRVSHDLPKYHGILQKTVAIVLVPTLVGKSRSAERKRQLSYRPAMQPGYGERNRVVGTAYVAWQAGTKGQTKETRREVDGRPSLYFLFTSKGWLAYADLRLYPI